MNRKCLKMALGISTLLLLLSKSSVFAQSSHRQVSEGNELYEQEKYDEANTKYRDALVEHPESPIINFNIGDVQYKKRNYEEALKTYEKALSSNDIQLQGSSYYNMGNALYRSGKLPESILYYKKALELNPNDDDAKFNLEYVRAKLKDEANKQQNQDKQQNQQQGEQNQQQQDQQNQEEEEQQEQPQQGQDRQEQKNEAVQNQEEEQSQEEKDSGEPQQAQQQEISREDAERILNALQNEEQDLLKDNRRKARVQGGFRGKDW